MIFISLFSKFIFIQNAGKNKKNKVFIVFNALATFNRNHRKGRKQKAEGSFGDNRDKVTG
jgi:hypothetical protein